MEGYWICSQCQAPTTQPATHLLCPGCEDKTKDLEKKLGQARGALKRLKKIAYPRPEATDIIDKVLKRL